VCHYGVSFFVMLNVVMTSVVMPNVVAPILTRGRGL